MVKKALILAVLISLVGCKSLSYVAEKPSADPTEIELLQQQLSEYEHISVTDEGVITYLQWVEPGYRWKVSVIQEFGYQISCVDLRPYLQKGFITEIKFNGIGGSTEQYDLYRCDRESSTN
ncbi:hypothetical protein FCV43_16600 [Vibrio genomosp. F6]|uniref:hypothetical protein n=1 Tax=Vibrio genomosp. F6 TaxID=723172 RepID=UPI0010BDC052|nr:hypothetical protein [Vibrio genomosp. F6]TKF18336.1 hypothetical protein FCV43_16600 [Vibrio genomosp. F6]